MSQLALPIRQPKYWSFSISLPNEYSGLIFFKIDKFDFLAVQGTQRTSSTTVLRLINSSALTFLYGTTLTSIHDYWKNHSFDQTDLSWQSNISVFNMLSKLVIAFLLRTKLILTSWLQSPSAVILEPKKIKSVTVFIVSSSICHESDRTGCHDLSFLNVEF